MRGLGPASSPSAPAVVPHGAISVRSTSTAARDLLAVGRALALRPTRLELRGAAPALEALVSELVAAQTGLSAGLPARLPVSRLRARGGRCLLTVWAEAPSGRVIPLARVEPAQRERVSVGLLLELPAGGLAALYRGDRDEAPAWPACLAPEQVRVLPVLPAHAAAAHALAGELTRAGLRVGPLEAAGPLRRRVGAATGARVPWVVVAGAEALLATPRFALRTRGARAIEQLTAGALRARLLAGASGDETNITRGGSPGAQGGAFGPGQRVWAPGRDAAEVAGSRGSRDTVPVSSAAAGGSGEEMVPSDGAS